MERILFYDLYNYTINNNTNMIIHSIKEYFENEIPIQESEFIDAMNTYEYMKN